MSGGHMRVKVEIILEENEWDGRAIKLVLLPPTEYESDDDPEEEFLSGEHPMNLKVISDGRH